MASRIWAFQRPLSKPMHTPDMCTRVPSTVPGRGWCSLYDSILPPSLPPSLPSFLSSLPVFLRPSIHILLPPGLRLCISITSHSGRLQSTSAHSYCASVTTFQWMQSFSCHLSLRWLSLLGPAGDPLQSLPRYVLTTCAVHFQSFIRSGYGFSLIIVSMSSGPLAPHRTGALPSLLCGLMEYKKGNQTDHWYSYFFPDR